MLFNVIYCSINIMPHYAVPFTIIMFEYYCIGISSLKTILLPASAFLSMAWMAWLKGSSGEEISFTNKPVRPFNKRKQIYKGPL